MKSGYREPARSTWLRPLGISIIDWALAIGAIAAVLHVPLIPLDEWAFRVGNPSHTDVFLGGTLILVLIKATRRSVGWPLPLTAILFMVYAIFGPASPGLLTPPGASRSEERRVGTKCGSTC